ncbi:hypothetical protein [Alicyclobacillus sp.]|uniref:hypothetical protein n=1 Tax=Alicyclobacillus sp. TaxID=61169 RepID=UPI0025BB0B01|nr:hypothetical protein [Alicyclobacillus sp.]MCL6517212.1 hypothetical protein [Alicyclobacillus sp.]
MAQVETLNPTTLRIHVTLQDAVDMVAEAARDVRGYAHDIVTIYEKMPMFDFVHFCFYAYDSARLFERQIGIDPRQYQSFSLDAPDSFFYTLYGGMAALYPLATAAEDTSAGTQAQVSTER